MRRLSTAALLAVPLLFLVTPQTASANPPYNGFGCGDHCLGMFRKIHQHGPLFNYGPYYGYYPFAPYGPWDQYLRYDPNFYGESGMYGRGPGPFGRYGQLHLGGHKSGCSSCGFWHASWLQGGWFKGHTWLSGSRHGHTAPACSSCGGVASATPAPHTGDALARYSGFGSAAQSAVFYGSTPTLNPVLDLIPVSGTK
ncbi:hypothetical protein R5W23_004442 [Gemmata sp. JC673]|uniref:Uncharacterized protein n=1 Tax=Gemmata algarum TaxID=2975278 RepID=A0ABU5F642_9BACT|nr:hypothetical protein [Gemmata algarum]MDY3562959.1 hypothetical protein [Gemmata algarum]